MGTDLKSAKAKVNAFFKLLLYGIGSCMECSVTEWNNAGDGVMGLLKDLQLLLSSYLSH